MNTRTPTLRSTIDPVLPGIKGDAEDGSNILSGMMARRARR
jgi:hypothetical protein